MSICAQCQQRPTGIDGHEDLFAHKMGGAQMQFKCRSCGHLWTRRYVGDGSFLWEQPRAGEHPGIEMPHGPGSRQK